MTDLDASGDPALPSNKKMHKRIVDVAQLRSAIFSLYTDQSTADVTLDAGGRRWYLHGCILSAWSQTWRDQYHQGHRAFRIAEGDADMVDELVRYLYSGELTLTSHNASTLLSLAQTLRIDGLSKRIQEEERKGSGRTAPGDGTPPLRESNGSVSSHGLSSSTSTGSASKPPLPSGPKPPLSPRPASVAMRPVVHTQSSAHSSTTSFVSHRVIPTPVSQPAPATPAAAFTQLRSPLALPLLPTSNSSTSVSSQQSKPPLPTGPKPQLSPRPSHNHINGVSPKSTASGPLSPRSQQRGLLGPLPSAPPPAPPTSASSSPSLPVIAGPPSPTRTSPPQGPSSPRERPASEVITHATPVPTPIAPIAPQPERRMSSAGVVVLGGTPAPVEDEAARKAREQKMAKLRKEKEKADKEAEKARDDSAMRHQLELVQRITLIETTHARIEAEAREKEKKERKEEEKRKTAQGKRASQAAWAPARPSSIRAAEED